METVAITRDGAVEPLEIEELRATVGWDAYRGHYTDIMPRHWCHYTVRENGGRLIGYLSILSDGVADAFLLDLMVHPAHARQGIGRGLVECAIRDVKAAGIRCVQVTFGDHLRAFYQRCGFHLVSGGIIDFQDSGEMVKPTV